MRLIDADAYVAEMKDRQDAAYKWREEAISEGDEVKQARAEGAFTAFVEAKLTMDKQPSASPWHRVEEPPQSGQECFTAYRSILRSDPEWLYDICYYTDDLARDCQLMDGAEHRPGWYRYESEYGDVECHPKYWMPIEPPKEDA